MPNKRIAIIFEKRSDAIHVVNDSLIKNLKLVGANLKTVYLDNKPFKNYLLNLIIEIVNTFRILFLIKRDDLVLFTDPLAINMLSSYFIPNKKFLIFHHYDREPSYYKFLPFISLKRTFSKLDGIVCSSTFSISQLNDLGINTATKCKVIHCGVNHELFKPTSEKIYDFEYILSIGSEEPRKNMKNILKAFSLLQKDFPYLKLIKTGRASNDNRSQTLTYIKEFGLSDSVIFTEFVEDSDLPRIYSGAKFLLFPSLLEGFGLPIVEAMACGCPVITSNRNPMRELVGPNQITVDPLNVNELYMTSKKILSDTKLRDQLIAIGIKRAQAFNWKKSASEIADFINKKA